eukprot:2942482-Pyramimonas_sp.AAC.1
MPWTWTTAERTPPWRAKGGQQRRDADRRVHKRRRDGGASPYAVCSKCGHWEYLFHGHTACS